MVIKFQKLINYKSVDKSGTKNCGTGKQIPIECMKYVLFYFEIPYSFNVASGPIIEQTSIRLSSYLINLKSLLMREYTNVNHGINDQNFYYIDCGRKNLAKCAVGSVRRIPTANSPKNIWRPHLSWIN